MKRIYSLKTILLLCALIAGSVSAWADNVTTIYYFSNKLWGATNVSGDAANWISGKDGASSDSNKGIQITTGTSGAYATSPVSFPNISKITVTYCTNASSGKGSIEVQVGGGVKKSFNVTAPSSNGTTLKTTEFDFDPTETGKVTLTVTCSTNSIYINNIAITSAPYAQVSVGTAGIATFCSEKALDFTGIDAIAVYTAKVEGSIVKLTQIHKVPANTGVILLNAMGMDKGAVALVNVPVLTTSADDVSDNELVGVITRTQVSKTDGTKYNYILQRDGNGGVVFNMAKTEGTYYLLPNKAYLSTTYDASANDARLGVAFAEEETSIADVNHETISDNRYYDLQGRRIKESKIRHSELGKGLYIVNGKKILIK